MINSIGLIILAGGKGTRMKSQTPKVLLETNGKPLLEFVLNSSLEFIQSFSLKAEIGLVIGHKKEKVEEWLKGYQHQNLVRTATQIEQKGTADAVKSCFSELPDLWKNEFTMVICGDTPLIQSQELSSLFEALKSNTKLVGVAATFETTNPTGYGRIIRGSKGFKIVEEKDANIEEKKITEVNSGLYVLRTAHLKEVLRSITNENISGEFYLTDLFQENFFVEAIKFPSARPFLGVNTMEQLAEVTTLLGLRKIKQLMLDGVQFLNPNSVYIDWDVTIKQGTIIYPNVTLLGKTKLGENIIVESGSVIKNSSVENDTQILANSYLEEALVSSYSVIGPMARLRPGTKVGRGAKIGNFVEIKKSQIEANVKISHLSYVGDSEIGENTNIGCGFITCNYDGLNKHKTIIGKNSFIGSDCQVIAPIELGDEVFIGAGSTITKNIPSGGFGIARAQQLTKEGAAKKFLKTKKN